MQQFELRRGLKFRDHDDRLWSLVRLYTADRLQFEDQHGVFQTATYRELRQRYLNGDWSVERSSVDLVRASIVKVVPPDLQSYAKHDQEKARFRFSVIERFVEICHVTNAALQEHCRKFSESTSTKPPSARTVRRWLGRYRQARDITALVDKPPVRKRLTVGLIGALFEQALEESYFLPERPPGTAVIETLARLVEEHNNRCSVDEVVQMPNPSTVYVWLKDLHPLETDRRRYTADEVDNMHRTALSTVGTRYPLERVEVDHTPLDVLVVHKITRETLGRPWITIAIDVRTRMILGFYITMRNPSINSLLECIRQSILPKDTLLKQLPDTIAEWPAAGIWHAAIFDNGMEEHAAHIAQVMEELNINWEFCPRRRGRYKPHVERFNKTLQIALIHGLPGSTFSNPKARGGYNSKKAACLDIEALFRIVLQWIVEKYHNTPHRGNRNQSPLDCWKTEITKRPLRLPVSPADLEITLGANEIRSLHHYGIAFDSIRYSSRPLQNMYSRLLGHGRVSRQSVPVHIRHHLHTVNYIDVLDPDSKAYFRVPAVDPVYSTAVDRDLHEQIKAHASQRAAEPYRRSDLARAQQNIEREKQLAVTTTKSARRHKQPRGATRTNGQSERLAKKADPAGTKVDSKLLKKTGDGGLPTFEPLLPKAG